MATSRPSGARSLDPARPQRPYAWCVRHGAAQSIRPGERRRTHGEQRLRRAVRGPVGTGDRPRGPRLAARRAADPAGARRFGFSGALGGPPDGDTKAVTAALREISLGPV